MKLKRFHSGLARDVLVLVISVVNLITAIIHLVSGATNYGFKCLAPIFTASR
jgi:hypothetical protein